MKKTPLLGISEAALDSLHIRNPPYSGNLVDITTLLGSSGGSSYDDTAIQAAVATNSAAIAQKADQNTTYTKTEVDTTMATKADQSALTSGLALKQDVISTGSQIPISYVNSLQGTLDAKSVASVTYTKGEVDAAVALKADQSALTTGLAGKQDVISTGSQIPISYVNSLQSTLNAKAVASVTYTKGEVDTLLTGKQATIADGDLTIARTSGLQVALDAKATTSALTTGLEGKQATITDGSLTIARTSGLQAALDAKATTSALTTGLQGKQATISDGDLTIARTSGLQAALDAKATTSALL